MFELTSIRLYAQNWEFRHTCLPGHFGTGKNWTLIKAWVPLTLAVIYVITLVSMQGKFCIY